MPLTLRISLMIGILFYFSAIFYFLRKRALALKYTILWILSGIVMLIIASFPAILDSISKFFGFSLPVNSIFTTLFFFLILIQISLTSIVSKLNDRTKNLIQNAALLERRVRELESLLNKTADINE